VSYDSISPVRAKQWIDFIVEDLNVEIRNKDVVLADKGIQYLESQLEKTKIADIQNIFFKLIEDQISKKLLAETKEEYVFEVIDPAVVAEKKVKPSRVLICLLGAFIGSLLSMIVIFVLHLHKTNKKIS
jgi:LPS O-antigen subunit length determinant protein (WzzB/FepE family)